MPQQLLTRADLRRAERRRRRAPRVRATSAGLAALTAAALTVATGVPSAAPAPRTTATGAATQPTAVTVSKDAQIEVEAGTVDPVTAVASAVEHASGTLLAAQHVAMEGVDATPDQAEQISLTTAVVRELVRRAAAETDVEVPAVAAAPAPAAAAAPAAADGAQEAAGTPAEDALAAEPTVPAASEASGDSETSGDPEVSEDSGDPEASEASGDSGEAPAVSPATAPSPASTLVRDGDTVAVDLTLTAPTPEVAAAADAVIAAVTAELADGGTEAPDLAVVVAAAIEQQTAALAELVAAPVTTVSVDPAPSPEEIAAQAKAEAEAAARQEAERIAELAAAASSYGNGQIPEELLVDLSWTDHAIRPDAAASLERLNAAFAAVFGVNLTINDGYRSYADQVSTKASRGRWAATPGYSNHGLAVAVDIGGLAYGNAMYAWLAENAGAYGWVNPDWAKAGGRKPEPWHWEFTG